MKIDIYADEMAVAQQAAKFIAAEERGRQWRRGADSSWR